MKIRGFRKYSIALLSLLFSFVALMCAKMTDVIFFQIVTAVLLLFGAANAANNYSKSDIKNQE
jgi:hypothetical protein